MNKTEVTKKVKIVLADYGLNEKQLRPEASFTNDLGLDSLDFAELILKTEQTFDISISFEYDDINTVGDLVNTIALKAE